MAIQEQLQGLVSKFNMKMEEDEEVRKEVAPLKKTFNFDLGDETYSFRLENAMISDFKPEMVREADVVVTCSAEDFRKILDGDLRPMRAFVTKKIRIEGKIQDLMFLKKFL